MLASPLEPAAPLAPTFPPAAAPTGGSSLVPPQAERTRAHAKAGRELLKKRIEEGTGTSVSRIAASYMIGPKIGKLNGD
jgi:hypothetical protein